MKGATVSRSLTPDRTFQVKGKPCQEFDCSVDAVGIGENTKLIGLTWNLPEGVSLNDAITTRGISQDATSKLLSVPTNLMPTEAQKYATADGKIAAAIFPDHADEYGQVHIVAGPLQDVTAFQQQLQQSGLALLLSDM